MKNFFKIILFIVEAIPLPFSVLSWIITLSFVGYGVVGLFENLMILLGIAFFAFIGCYPITYIYAIVKTRENKGLCLWSFVPIAHVLVVASVFCLLEALN